MPEFTVLILVIAPLLVLTYAALQLVQVGAGPNKMTESSRQRLAGCGLLLLCLTVLVSLSVLSAGLYCTLTILKIPSP